jgi:DNA mismatch repair protein MutL
MLTPVQLWQRYIVVPGLGDMLIIDQRAAHERVLFEMLLKDLESQNRAIQKLLWPETLQYPSTDAVLLTELLPHLQYLGFDIAEFGHGSFIVHGIPAIMTDLISPQQAIDDILDRFKEGHQLAEMKPVEKIAFALASNLSRRRGEIMTTQEMQILIEQLMASDNPYAGPSGRKTFITFGKEDILRRFQS